MNNNHSNIADFDDSNFETISRYCLNNSTIIKIDLANETELFYIKNDEGLNNLFQSINLRIYLTNPLKVTDEQSSVYEVVIKITANLFTKLIQRKLDKKPRNLMCLHLVKVTQDLSE